LRRHLSCFPFFFSEKPERAIVSLAMAPPLETLPFQSKTTQSFASLSSFTSCKQSSRGALNLRCFRSYPLRLGGEFIQFRHRPSSFGTSDLT
jgi:hypothetical protein